MSFKIFILLYCIFFLFTILLVISSLVSSSTLALSVTDLEVMTSGFVAFEAPDKLPTIFDDDKTGAKQPLIIATCLFNHMQIFSCRHNAGGICFVYEFLSFLFGLILVSGC